MNRRAKFAVHEGEGIRRETEVADITLAIMTAKTMYRSLRLDHPEYDIQQITKNKNSEEAVDMTEYQKLEDKILDRIMEEFLKEGVNVNNFLGFDDLIKQFLHDLAFSKFAYQP